jgi:ATP-binding cassette subfamily C protein
MQKERIKYVKKLVSLFYSEYSLKIVFAVFLNLISGLLGGFNLLLLIPVLNIITTDNASAPDGFTGYIYKVINSTGLEVNLINVLLLFLVFYIASGVFQRFALVLNNRYQMEFQSNLQKNFFDLMTKSRWDILRKEHSSNYVKIITNDINRTGGAITQLLQLYSSVINITINLIVAFIMSFYLTATGIAIMAILLLLLQKNNILIYDESKSNQLQTKTIFSKITEYISGLKIAKINGGEAFIKNKFDESVDKIKDTRINVQLKQSQTKLLFSIFAAIFLTGFIYVGIEFFNTGSAVLLLLIAIFSRLTGSFSSLNQNYQRLLSMLPSFADYVDYYAKLKNNIETDELEQIDIHLKNKIEFKNVSFSYDKGEIFSNISLIIQKGKINTLVGESGTGKTTIADLICGLLKPNEGTILIDDLELTHQNYRAWLKKVSYVTQDNYLFDMTIRENMLLAYPKATDEEIWEALKKASVFEFVKNQPEQLDVLVGERGSRISGGERQRLQIAVALIKQPDLIILDEATSALDEVNEEKILKSLKKLTPEITIFVISHKRKVLEFSENQLFLENKKVNILKESINGK